MSYTLSVEDIENARKRKALRLQAEEASQVEGEPSLHSGSTSATIMSSDGSNAGSGKRTRQKTGNPPANRPGTPTGDAADPANLVPQSAGNAGTQAVTPALTHKTASFQPVFVFELPEHTSAIIAMGKKPIADLAKKMNINFTSVAATKVAILRFMGTTDHIIYDKDKSSFTLTNLQKQDFAMPAAPAQA